VVLLGLCALVIDVGQLYQERAELQNGADAAAIAVAKSCALGSCTPSIAAAYANANASVLTGHQAAANLVCGSGTLGTCPASTGLLTDCPAPPPAGTNYVDVHTSTQTAGGGTLLGPTFARVLLGNGNYSGTTVLACSQAEWGAPTAAQVTSFTISACEWDQATSLGTVYAQPPPYPPNSLPPSSLDRVLRLRSGEQQGCGTEPAGSDAPGNFGWTNDPNGTCSLLVNAGTYGVKPGVSASQACKTALAADQANKTLIFLPVYTTVTGRGRNAVYTLKGFAAFVVTGYSLPGFSAPDWLNPANNCRGSSKCLNGYFTQGLIPYTSSLGGTNLGAVIIRLTG
jgi:Putative Flp pilus-assembly TadE/G-like